MSAIKDKWCSCIRLREAEEKAARWDGIVLCRDCKHFYQACGKYATHDFCTYLEIMAEPNGFCAWGERRQS